MLVYGINSKTEKEGEKWKSKETINHFKKQAAVFEIIRLEFVSDVSFCEGVSAAAASRCWWELNHTDQEEWHWHLTYGQRFHLQGITYEPHMQLIRFTETSLNCSTEQSSWSCWDTSAEQTQLIQTYSCNTVCAQQPADICISDTHLAKTLHYTVCSRSGSCEQSRAPDCRQQAHVYVSKALSRHVHVQGWGLNTRVHSAGNLSSLTLEMYLVVFSFLYGE